MKKTLFLTTNTYAKIVDELREAAAEGAHKVNIMPTDTRSVETNKKFQAMCGDMARQVGVYLPDDDDEEPSWHHVEYLREMDVPYEKLSQDNMRHVLMASFCHAESVPGFERGLVVSLYPSTTELSYSRGKDFIDYIYSVGNDAGVEWSEPKPEWEKRLEEMRKDK